ncbi:MAG TPA: TetR/AcrR family transcriptional regulator [Candidatus Gastranaerophilales bacterium]|nr:TetR/AcrR family transcriptional regulator [Candidatus Gastranaerophilales bacterium]
MTENSDEKASIKEKIIDVASEIFAAKGYQNTTVREICQKADTYQLSINYHFGGKENLFREVILKTYEDTEEILLMAKIKLLPPEQQLEEVIRTRIRSVFSDEKQGKFFKIVAKEVSHNYNFLMESMSTTLIKYLDFIKDIFKELSGNKLDEFELNYCTHLLISHISSFGIHEKAKLLLFNTKNPDDEYLEKFIQQAKSFVIAGVEHIKKEKGDIL